MKNLIRMSILTVVAVLFISCKKDKIVPNIPLKSGIEVNGAFITNLEDVKDLYVLTYQLSDGKMNYYWLNDSLSTVIWTTFKSDEPLRVEVFSTTNPQEYKWVGELRVEQDSSITVSPYSVSDIEVNVYGQYIKIEE